MDKDVLRQGVFLALQQPNYVANPYRLYNWLRSKAPFYWDFVLCGWFLTRYGDVKAALADPRLITKNFPFDVSQLPPDLQRDLAPLGRVMNKSVFHNDGSEHERLRYPLNRAFNPAVFERLRSEMELLADKLLAAAERRRSIDVVGDYSQPLANHMTSELLGLPHGDRAKFIKWCDRLKQFIMAPRMGRETVFKAKQAVSSFRAVRDYVRTMIAARQEHFADDLIGRSLAMEVNEARPTEDEIFVNCVLFVHTGAQNMAASITNGVITLLRHPEQFARLREDPHLISTAVEELLRYETPIQVAIRGAPEEIDFRERRIGPKQLVVLLLGAANRDPEQFADPDRLDLTRYPNRHISFGVGPHGCVGGRMARFGLAIAIEAILQRKTELRLKPGKPQWNFPAMRRTLHALPVFVGERLNSTQRFRLRMAHSRPPRSNRFAQTSTVSLR